MADPAVRDAWEAEYRAGRYRDEPPLAFVQDLIAAARAHGIDRGLYVGCGNGRNFVPLVEAGLDLDGLDVAPTAIAQLAERLPSSAPRLRVGDLASLPEGARYPMVLGLQVFQHGDRAACHAHVAAAARAVAPGGLLGLSVNAVGTDLAYAATVTERGPDSGFTVRYRAGPKRGLLVHFFDAVELTRAIPEGFSPVLGPRLVRHPRDPPSSGVWCQWEGIWVRAQ
ncbi:MAG TPA: methyltransferase domain-containing protein [Thermoplasmata archaeon]|nr:methyltransferase domain-containing protein [Thermoplasmata archaeon]